MQSTVIITLDGSKSFDPDGWIVSYQWTQISGDPVQIINPDSMIARAVIPTKGTRTFKIIGIDNEGARGTKIVKKIIK